MCDITWIVVNIVRNLNKSRRTTITVLWIKQNPEQWIDQIIFYLSSSLASCQRCCLWNIVFVRKSRKLWNELIYRIRIWMRCRKTTMTIQWIVSACDLCVFVDQLIIFLIFISFVSLKARGDYSSYENSISSSYSPSYSSNNGPSYGPPSYEYGPPVQTNYGYPPAPLPPTSSYYGPPMRPYYSYGPPPPPHPVFHSAPRVENWLLDKFKFKLDLFTIGKLLIKLILFKKFIKFVALICLLLFLPKLQEKGMTLLGDDDEDDEEDVSHNNSNSNNHDTAPAAASHRAFASYCKFRHKSYTRTRSHTATSI